MAIPPSLKTSMSASRANLHASPARDAFELRAYAIHQIGHPNFKPFELWAFKAQEVIIYDDRIIWMWNNTHNRDPVYGSTRECLDGMIRIWKSRFSAPAGESEEDIFPIELGTNASSSGDEWPVKIDFGD